MTTEDYECETCGSLPGEGITAHCYDPEGCGYTRKQMNNMGIEGGQGRTNESVQSSGEWMGWLLCVGMVAGAALVLSGAFR